MRQGVQRRPIRVRDWPLRVIAVHLERREVIALFGKPRLERIAGGDGDVSAAIARFVRLKGVVRHDRVRLPLSPDDVAKRPGRDVREVRAAGVARSRRNHGIAVNQRDDTLHFAVKLSQPLRIVVLLLLFARRQLRPDAVNQPDRVRSVSQIPVPQRAVEMRRMHGVDTNRVRAHVGDDGNPPLVGAVVRWKLRREFSRKRGTQVHGLDPHRRPLAGAFPDFDDAPPGSRHQNCRCWSHPRRQHHVREQLRDSGEIRERGRIPWYDPQRPLETVPSGGEISISVRSHARASHGVVGGRVCDRRAPEERARIPQTTLPHCSVAGTGQRSRIVRAKRQRALELGLGARDVTLPICRPTSFHGLIRRGMRTAVKRGRRASC